MIKRFSHPTINSLLWAGKNLLIVDESWRNFGTGAIIGMFFSEEILFSRGGKFAVIWLAATRQDKLKLRQYENENIEETW